MVSTYRIVIFDGHKYHILSISSVDRNTFLQLIDCIKTSGGFYNPEIKKWAIREDLLPTLNEKIATLAEYISELDSKRTEFVEIAKQSLSSEEDVEYSDEYKELRKQVAIRDDNKCQICGKIPDTCHHIIPKSYGGEDAISNMVMLCSSCHGKIHSYYHRKAINIIYSENKEFFNNAFDELKNEFQEVISNDKEVKR